MTLITETIPDNLEKFYVNWMGEKSPILGVVGENLIYSYADDMSRDYKGGLWDFRQLSNGGFYTFPKIDRIVGRHPDFGDIELSGQAFGLAVSMMTVNHLCWMQRLSEKPYYRLLAYLSQVDCEGQAIFPEAGKVHMMLD